MSTAAQTQKDALQKNAQKLEKEGGTEKKRKREGRKRTKRN